jgi:GLPGLI family protein
MRKIIIVILFALPALYLGAQANTQFVTKGKIEFERKMNTHRLFFSGEQDSWTEMFKKAVPQFRTDYFELFFSEGKSLYKPGKDSDVPKIAGWRPPPAMENVVFKDLEKQVGISQKQVFESLFLMSDSLQPVEWKIVPETRTIAGFECKKAITRICDSVVVVAFYTEEIIPSGGPESFHGLPGMILGLAIPRLYTTWFATKLEVLSPSEEAKITAPTKGKKKGLKEIQESIYEATKDWTWDKGRDRNMWLSVL